MKDSKIVFFIQQIDSKSEKTEDTPSRRPAPAAPSTRRGGAWFNNAIHHIVYCTILPIGQCTSNFVHVSDKRL